ncbi:hypothetical protein MNJPNG_26950 [Cupriavidus oxalaticus]
MMAPDNAITPVSPSSRVLRFMLPASEEMKRLVRTANAPEIAMPWPAIPSVTCKSVAIGVSRLTGMNSEAINAKTQSVMAKTPLQYARGDEDSGAEGGETRLSPEGASTEAVAR